MRYKKLIIIHPGKANYPEINAYRRFFSSTYDIEIYRKEEVPRFKFDNSTILWFIMGFYSDKFEAGFIIHDYRSLSVGKFARIKDKIKKWFNQKPNLRIFLNKALSKKMNFSDNIPEVYIDMGIPEAISKYININFRNYKYDFIYVGEISKERESDKMINNFLKQYGRSKTLLLVGNYEKKIYFKYKNLSNIIFTGKVSQEKVFEYIIQSEICINFIPNKYPYNFQTSTKFLEYASLKKKIISSKITSNELTASKYNINTYFTNNFEFPSYNILEKLEPNIYFNYKLIMWDTLIKNSGVLNFIRI